MEPTEINYQKIVTAFGLFGIRRFDISLEKFKGVKENDVFAFGRNPVGVDMMTAVKGLNFEDAYQQSIIFNDEGLMIQLIHINQLLEAKKALSRLKDLDDLEQLQKLMKH